MQSNRLLDVALSVTTGALNSSHSKGHSCCQSVILHPTWLTHEGLLLVQSSLVLVLVPVCVPTERSNIISLADRHGGADVAVIS
jgi:hypothetical protein